MKERIRQLMEHEKMTQKEFAGELCMSEGTLSSIFTGRTKPTNNIVSAIHERFPNVNISWLMFGEEEMFESSSAKDTGSATESNVGYGKTPDPYPGDLFSGMNYGGVTSPVAQEKIKFIDKPQRKITEIRVFYDDGTFETFSA